MQKFEIQIGEINWKSKSFTFFKNQNKVIDSELSLQVVEILQMEDQTSVPGDGNRSLDDERFQRYVLSGAIDQYARRLMREIFLLQRLR